MILLIDNYDSFTYNLAHLFGELGAEVIVRRNDALDADEAERLAPSHLVLSPGPGRPGDAGASVEIVQRLAPSVPTLGVCLGHQAIVEGRLAADRDRFDALVSCFPAGTVSGAPKVRAMQLISELEGYRRGPYAGAVLYALPGEALDACIAIRTIVLDEGVALLQAGAGIVADSDPAAEHDECLRKLAALETAIELAEARS